ncbi:MAG TPA: histidine phosphatase family protein [Flavihumibacter sp.]|jgi:phosphohistidine phosphatase SixA
MSRYLFLLNLSLILMVSVSQTALGQKYYIVRHAEKAHPTGDTPLSEAGLERAQALKEKLKDAKIAYVFTTNTLRTKQTAQPTAEHFKAEIQTYGKIDAALIDRFKSLKKNTLIVGHSNTLDELLNGMLGGDRYTDLDESIFDRLFIITKKGKRLTVVESTYGQPSSE